MYGLNWDTAQYQSDIRYGGPETFHVSVVIWAQIYPWRDNTLLQTHLFAAVHGG